MPSSDLLSFALTALVTLFVTIGPIEGAAIYAGLTPGIHASERGVLAWRSVLIAGLLLFAFALAGNPVLARMHVSLPAFRFAAGVMLFLQAISLVCAMNADPLIAHEAQPTATMAALVHADERLRKSFAQIKLPLLILHGTADKAAKAAGSQLFYDQAGSSDKTLKLYEGGFHDLLNDTDKERVMGDITSWMRAHINAN